MSTLRRDSKTAELVRNDRRRTWVFPLSHCCSEDYRACLPGPLYNSGRKGATCSVQATRRARTRSCSSPNLAPNYSASELPPSTSRADLGEDPKRGPPLNPDTFAFEAEEGHWTEEGCKGPHSIRGQTVLHPSAYVRLQLEGVLSGKERHRSPFTSTPCPSTRSAQVSQSFSKPVVLQIRHT